MTNILNVPKARHGPRRYKSITKNNGSPSATKSTTGGNGDHQSDNIIDEGGRGGVESDRRGGGGGGMTVMKDDDHPKYQSQSAIKSVLKRNKTTTTKGGTSRISSKSNNKYDDFDFRTSSSSTKSESAPAPSSSSSSATTRAIKTHSATMIISNKSSSNNHGITHQGGVVGLAGGGRRRGRKRRSSDFGAGGEMTAMTDCVDRHDQQQPAAPARTTKEPPLQTNKQPRKVSTVKSSRRTTAPSSSQTPQESRKLFHQDFEDDGEDENAYEIIQKNTRHQTHHHHHHHQHHQQQRTKSTTTGTTPKRRTVPTGTDIMYAESAPVKQQHQEQEKGGLMTTRPSPPSPSIVMTNHTSTNNNRYAVAIDTRFMNTSEGRTSFDEFCTSVSEFLYSTSVHRQGHRQRGSLSVLPVGVAWTTSSFFSSSSLPTVGTGSRSGLTGSTKTSLTTGSSKKQRVRTFRSSSTSSSSSKPNHQQTIIGRGGDGSGGGRLRPTEKSSVVVHYESTSTPLNAEATTGLASSSLDDSSSETGNTTIIQDNIRRIAYEFLQSGSVSGDCGSTKTATAPVTTETNSTVEIAAAASAPAAVGCITAGEGNVGYDGGAAAVPITPLMNHNINNNNKNVISLPKAMMAHATWEYYGDLVESIVRNNPRMPGMGPLHVSVLASDTAVLLDMTESSHKYGIDKFWKRIKRNFERDQIHSIDLVVVKSNKTVVAHELVSQDDLSYPKTGLDQLQHHEKDMDSPEKMTNSEGPEKPPAVEDSQDAVNPDADPAQPKEDTTTEQNSAMSASISEMKSERIGNIDDLLRNLEKHLRIKSQNDFRRGKSAMQFDKHIVTQVDISVSSMNNNRICFQNIIHQWVRQSLAAVSTRIDCPLSQTVRLQLQETLAYDAYTVSCQVSYKHVPCLDTESANLERFLVDLKLLSQARLKIEQIVPIESVDSSLLFGVPISIQAGIDGNKDEYTENMDVVRALFKQLAERDCALLILSTGPDEEAETVTLKGRQPGLFHCDYQHFVLLPELESYRSEMSSCQGVMYRLANSENSFQGTNDLDISNSDGESTNDATAYVEDFLESLSCAPINPMMLSRPTDLRSPLRGYSCKNNQKGKKSVTWEEPSTQRPSLQGHSLTESPTRSIDHHENNESDDDDDDVQMPSADDVEGEETNNKPDDQSLLPQIKDPFELLQEQHIGADSTQADNSDNDSTDSSLGLLDTSRSSFTANQMYGPDNDGDSKRTDKIDSKKPEDDVLIDSDTEADSSKKRRAFLIDFPQKKMGNDDDDEDSEAEWKDSDDDVVANKSSRKFRKLNKKPRKSRPKQALPMTKSSSTKKKKMTTTIDDITKKDVGGGGGGGKDDSDATVKFDDSSSDSDNDSHSSSSSSSTSDTSSTDSSASDNSCLSGTKFEYGH